MACHKSLNNLKPHHSERTQQERSHRLNLTKYKQMSTIDQICIASPTRRGHRRLKQNDVKE